MKCLGRQDDGNRHRRVEKRRCLLLYFEGLYVLNFHTAKADLPLQPDGRLWSGVRLTGDVDAAACTVQSVFNPVPAGCLDHQVAKGSVKTQPAVRDNRLAAGEIQHQAAKGHIDVAALKLLRLDRDPVGAKGKVPPDVTGIIDIGPPCFVLTVERSSIYRNVRASFSCACAS